jgi:hypothetical protein
MTRRRSSVPGPDRSDRRRSLPILLLAIVAVLAVACGGAVVSGTPTPEGTATASGEPSSSGSASEDPGASTTPSTEPTETAEPTEPPTEPPPSEEPSEAPSDEPTPAAGGAAACTGTAKNKDFYMSVATAVGWTVYCPVLPAGWFVESGQYRLAGGGRMEIGYKGPSGAHLTLSEGAFCGDADGCAPAGTENGTAAFGDREGTLVVGDDGSWSVVVDAGEKPSWLIVGTGMDEASLRGIAAKLAVVGG